MAVNSRCPGTLRMSQDIPSLGHVMWRRSCVLTTNSDSGLRSAPPVSSFATGMSSACATRSRVWNEGLPMPRSIWLSSPALTPDLAASASRLYRSPRADLISRPRRSTSSRTTSSPSSAPGATAPFATLPPEAGPSETGPSEAGPSKIVPSGTASAGAALWVLCSVIGALSSDRRDLGRASSAMIAGCPIARLRGKRPPLRGVRSHNFQYIKAVA
jgi:hypothetical protein